VTTNFDLVELPPGGNIRFTGFTTASTMRLNADGSIMTYAIAGLGRPAYWQQFPLKGFDANNNPQWNMSAEDTLAVTPVITGADPVDWGTRIMTGGMSSSDIIVSFDKDIVQNGHGYGYHLGGLRAGGNKWLWRTAKSTTPAYQGPFPADGSFDVGNSVVYPGGVALVVDRNIFWGYHGEFWKASQVNKWNQVYDDGLFIGQFGITGPEVAGQIAAPMMAGNVFTANVVKDPGGDLYLYHNDESHHSALHRWKISGLNTIQEQTIHLSIAPANEAGFLIFPNPVQNMLYLKHPPGGTVIVLTASGQRLQTIRLTAGSTNSSFNTNLLLPGYYVLQYSNAATVITQRFIKY
jgi:hypothetical protein